jgi:hypothetical protein
MPRIDATSPVTTASRITEPRICRRDAPIIRSRPNSFVRCATVIPSVLKMMNAPTKSETKPNTSSAVRRILSPSSSPFRSKRSCDCADWTSAPGGRTSAIAACTSAAGTPGSPLTRIESTFPGSPNSCCAPASENTAALAEPIESTPPKLTIPLIVYSCTGPSDTTPIVSPTS